MTYIYQNIEKQLKSIHQKDDVVLSVDKKSTMLRSVFESRDKRGSEVAVKSTAFSFAMFSGVYRYTVPVIVLAIFSLQVYNNAPDAVSEFFASKSDYESFVESTEFRNRLSQAKKDIDSIKKTSDVAQKEILANELSKKSADIRNRVAALVDDNKISEAKQIVLTLETALKSDELYKVATSVQAEIDSTIGMRVDIERKESSVAVDVATSSKQGASTTLDIEKRLENAMNFLKEVVDATTSTSTLNMVNDAGMYVDTSANHLKAGDLEKSIISLQVVDRIVAEIKLALLL